MFDIDGQHLTKFENEVQDALEDLLQMDIPDWISPHRGAPELYDDSVQGYSIWEYVSPHLVKLKWFSRKYKDQSSFEAEFESEIEENAIKAQELLNQKSIRERICPVLTKGSNDFFDIAKNITPVLLGASIVGSLPFTLTPLVVALAALLIARVGIHGFCKDNIEITK
jgi:hypothetical protein